MARDLKFRIWDGKQMFLPADLYGDIRDEFALSMYGDVYYFEEVSNGNYCPASLEAKTKHGVTVMQFTGLKEHAHDDTSQNRDIYEGDIIEFSNGERLTVEWNDDTCQFQFSDGSPINDGERYATHKMIVGNLYENPELLPPQQV